MQATGDSVDFYVTPLDRFATVEPGWLVCSPSPTYCVAVGADRDDAIAQAIGMAEYRAQGGTDAQVHVRDAGSASWRTVWSPAEVEPRFP